MRGAGDTRAAGQRRRPRTLATRLVQRLGPPAGIAAAGLTTLFPTPRAVAEGDLNGLGLTNGRIAAIQSLAQAVVSRRLDFGAGTDEIVDFIRSGATERDASV